tara:strand:- start:11047 stop:11532 length:486 start_codon:yes stop_codon:yes gene_type:complete
MVMSAPPLQPLALKDLANHASAGYANTFCVYFKSPPGASDSPAITVTPFMLERGLNPVQEERSEVAIVQAKMGLKLEMAFELPHRLDEGTVQSVQISEVGSKGALKGRLVFANRGSRGTEEFVVEAYNERKREWKRNFVQPGQKVMMLKITYQIVQDRWRV